MQVTASINHRSHFATANFHSRWRSIIFPSQVELSRRRLSPTTTSSGAGNFLSLLSCSSTPLWRWHVAPKPTTTPQGFAVDVLPEKALEQEVKEVTVKAPEEGAESWLRRRIDEIKGMLGTMGDGEITISAYDTAWVALVEDIHGNGGPQFPSSLQWIVDNQLPDGSWGDAELFTAHDRLINTLACVIALKTWDVSPEKCTSGLEYLRDNMGKLEEEDSEHMPIGFEIAFPSILDLACRLGLEIPYDTPGLQEIHTMRSLKLNRITKDLVHKVPTTLLHSLEGMPELDWERLLRLQCSDGSFLFSPSSTAYGLMQTKDEKCLQYLEKIVARFNGGVPNVYPVDMFEHIWAIDRLERLGISRYFEQEIKESLDYVKKYWTDDGICWARNTCVHDVDDTAMAFRLLRLHGYDVSADVFRNFYKDGEFFCFAGQSNQAVTGMYNLNRASQVQLPGESILEEAREFTYGFLRQKQASNQLLDKWIITKDLPGEVEYALDFPWYASLARVEARIFLEQYGGDKDVWIGKTLYRMPYVSNDTYLEAAKTDFNRCQAVHQEELHRLTRWLEECGLVKLGVRQEKVLEAYFLVVCSVFEPERSTERIGWARSALMMEIVTTHLHSGESTIDKKRAFIKEFQNFHIRSDWKKTENQLVGVLHHIIELTALDAVGSAASEHQKIRNLLRQAWEDWLVALVNEGDDGRALLLARTVELCAGRFVLEDSLSTSTLTSLSHNSDVGNNNELQQCSRLAQLTSSMNFDNGNGNGDAVTCKYERTESLDSSMQELVQFLLKSSSGLDRKTKKTFLTIAKTFYYAAHCPPATMKMHLSRVLFEEVV